VTVLSLLPQPTGLQASLENLGGVWGLSPEVRGANVGVYIQPIFRLAKDSSKRQFGTRTAMWTR